MKQKEPQSSRRPKLTIIEAFVGIVLLPVLGIRFTSLVLLGVLLVLYLAYPLYQRRTWLVVVGLAYFGSLVLPLDIEVGGFPWRHIESKHTGPRFVHCSGTCMPARTYLVGKYGEYVEHPSAHGLTGPRWILVWD